MARRLAEAGAAHGTTVIAEHQTAGRGRHGRSWSDRPGASLLLSMVLRPDSAAREATDPAVLPLLVGLACARAIRAAGGPAVGVEWPNDLVIGDAKLGGILCEASLRAGSLDFVVVGIGINVEAVPDHLDADVRAHAIALADASGGRAADRTALAGELVRRIVPLRADSGFAGDDLAELRRLDALAGRRVRLATGREGIARGILPDGGLAIEADGEQLIVHTGSVAPVAPRRP